MIDTNTIDRAIGSTVYDRDGDKIGKVNQVYVDDQTGRPLWASVHTGLFGTSETVVPLEDARWDGDDLRIAYDKDRVKDAPRVETDAHISESEQDELFRYYGLGSGAGTTDRERTVGHDTSGPNTDTAMTRSEEQLNVGTEKVQTGRARLRKHVVTENRTVTVPVTREEVRVEREPITDANAAQARSGPDLSEEEHEVVLTEERPVVQKETVPVERVRLDKETVTENESVSEDVRKEQIEYRED
ncbi:MULTISPECIES: PRC and DUF2382 domain-containing protein [unclassified Agromyces]|uniref:PRC and DUF2382 domain-containing protein n=1 Tax=unclassified Agromyces TaxID=2639701 RepID=UPI0030155759